MDERISARAVSASESFTPPPLVEVPELERLAELAAKTRRVSAARPMTFSRRDVARLRDALDGKSCVAWETPGSYFPHASWEDLEFERANFRGAVFGEVRFTAARFGDGADFTGASFGLLVAREPDPEESRFVWKEFDASTEFVRCRFEDHACFDHTSWHGDADFAFASFGRAAQFASLRLRGHLSFRVASFGPAMYFEVPEQEERYLYFDFCRATLGVGSIIEVRTRYMRLILEEAALGSRVIIASDATGDRDVLRLGSSHVGRGVLLKLNKGRVTLDRIRGESLRIVGDVRLDSLVDAYLDELSLEGVDAAGCRWAGASVGTLRLGANVRFAERVLGPRRRVLGEDWVTGRYEVSNDPDHNDTGPRVTPAELEARYRTLRVALEHGENGSIGNDFYYGEMEMRRKGRRLSTDALVLPNAQSVVLHAYWIMCGYGLRAWRSLATLLVVLVSAGWLFSTERLAAKSTQAVATSSAANIPTVTGGPMSLSEGIVVAAQQGLSVRAPDDVQFTTAGNAVAVNLRLLVPLLLAFTAVAVRNRISRRHPWR